MVPSFPCLPLRRFAIRSIVCAAMLLVPALAAGGDSTLKDDASKAGRATGSVMREVGQGLKQVGKEIGSAAKEGGKEFRRALKGESR